MTYGVAMKLHEGIVFAADTRTNAGVDNVACYRKLHCWERPGDRVVVLLSAGNLSVTQSVVAILNEPLAAATAATAAPGAHTLLDAPSMFHAARLVGEAVRAVRKVDGPSLEASKSPFSASFILGGQIRGEDPRLFQIYAEGNFIESADETPFLQIGEHKYGKPILDRVARRGMPLAAAAKLILLSFDSTLRSNLSVGMPLDLLLYRSGAFRIALARRIEADDAYFQALSTGWSESLRSAFARLPPMPID
jgi:putative proteasome-type protease